MQEITAGLLLRAYASGYFPMAEDAEANELFWFDPPKRGIIPLEQPRVPRRLRRTVRRGVFEVRFDHDFLSVIEACAEPTADRPKTWINRDIIRLYGELAESGFAHSVECWREGRLVGGLYGVSLGGAFFGESMFSRATDASKVAMVHLLAELRRAGFALLDTQFVTDHLRQFGGTEIGKTDYRRRLNKAIAIQTQFGLEPDPEAVEALLAESAGGGQNGGEAEGD
jgi:leucyl/phenylalanyl-tRNA--protein transferase